MSRPIRRAALALALSLPLLIAGGLPAAADTAQQSASITISDSGYSPRSATIFMGGSVSFTNSGGQVHTATTQGGAPFPFDTGGLSSGQSTAFTPGLPGTYNFNSATDCLNGQNNPQFNCGGGVVTVVGTSAPAAPAAPVAPTAPAPIAAAPGVPQQSATASISDKNVTPATVTVAPNGTVTWTNTSSSMVHTATTTGTANPTPFDTGGLGPGQSTSLTFAQPGTYTYTSATDCINNSNPGGFGCGPYQVVVSGSPVTAAPVTAPTGASPVPVVSNTTVMIDDANGFTPNTLTIGTGQTVTWINSGSQVHTATSNPGYYNAWDSGGLDKGQKFSNNFTIPGTYGYHSDTEPVYTADPNDSTITIKSFRFNGTIVVQ
ncbi:MAG TPA: hypothetical protein VK457_01085 [Chloroflexota bacterium]|nr:hypothetical protein [Chloroflexota bacterium]